MRWEVPTMASRKSCSEPAGLFSPALLRHWLRRSWPCWVGTLLLGMLLLPVHLGSALSNQLRFSGDITTTDVASLVCNLGTVVLGATAVLGLIAAILVSRQLFTARSANFFHNLPLRREGLFLTGAVAGLMMLWLPVLPVAAVTAAVEAAFGLFHGESLLWLLLYWLCSSLLFFGMGMLCCQLAGMTVSAVGLYVAANSWVLVLYAVLSELLGTLLVGYPGASVSTRAVRVLTPVWALGGVASEAANVSCGGVSGAILPLLRAPGLYALAGAALLGAALLFARARHSERAGDLLAFGWMRPVFKIMLSVGAGAAMGLMTLLFYGVNAPGFWGVLLPTLGWSLAAWLVAEMLVRKSVHIFQWRVFLRWGVVALVLAAALGGVRLDVLGVGRHVPTAAEVASVRVSYAGRFADLDDPAEAIALHHMLVDHRDELRLTNNADTQGIRLRYTLRDGSTLERQYYIPVADSLVEMDELQRHVYLFLTNPEMTLLLALDGPLARDELREVTVEWYDPTFEAYVEPELTDEQMWELYQAIEADIRAGRFDYGEYLVRQSSESLDVQLYIRYKHRTESAQRRAEGPATWEEIHWCGIPVLTGMTRTVEALRALGWQEYDGALG